MMSKVYEFKYKYIPNTLYTVYISIYIFIQLKFIYGIFIYTVYILYIDSYGCTFIYFLKFKYRTT